MADALREQAAIAALCGLLADPTPRPQLCRPGESCAEAVARIAVEHADQLVAKLRAVPAHAGD